VALIISTTTAIIRSMCNAKDENVYDEAKIRIRTERSSSKRQ